MSKFSDPMPRSEHECPRCHQVLQPLSNGIPHHCKVKELPYEEMCEALQGLQEHYGETYAQHRNETAQFGDSWPGAQIELSEMGASVRKLEAEIEAHPDHNPLRSWDEKLSDDFTDDDIPF